MGIIRSNRIGRTNYFLFLIGLGIIWAILEFQVFGILNLMLNVGFRADPTTWGDQVIWITVLQVLSDACIALFTIRRLHDANITGWFVVGLIGLAFATYIHFVFGILAIIGFLVVLFMPSTIGPNKFGPDPRGWKSREQFDAQEEMLAEQQKK